MGNFWNATWQIGLCDKEWNPKWLEGIDTCWKYKLQSIYLSFHPVRRWEVSRWRSTCHQWPSATRQTPEASRVHPDMNAGGIKPCADVSKNHIASLRSASCLINSLTLGSYCYHLESHVYHQLLFSCDCGSGSVLQWWTSSHMCSPHGAAEYKRQIRCRGTENSDTQLEKNPQHHCGYIIYNLYFIGPQVSD